MNLSVLALLLRPAPGQRSVLALPIVPFGVVTTLVLTVIGRAQAACPPAAATNVSPLCVCSG